MNGEEVRNVEDTVALVHTVIRRKSIRKNVKYEFHRPRNGVWKPGTKMYYEFKNVILQKLIKSDSVFKFNIYYRYSQVAIQLSWEFITVANNIIIGDY